jgi:hypothetical protein
MAATEVSIISFSFLTIGGLITLRMTLRLNHQWLITGNAIG